MWEERFQTSEYVFGTAPAAFMKRHETRFAPGARALSVADGEGRNAVFLAERGLDVTALEYAPSAIAKARRLAESRGVQVDFREVDVLDYDWPERYDIILGVFIQFAGPELRGALFDGMKSAVAPGGLIALHGYTPEQLEYGTGGPPHAENMYTEELLSSAFVGWDILVNASYEAEIHEGKGHSGHSALIDFIARKPS